MKCSNPACMNVVTNRGKYCSRSCAAKVNNSKHPKRKLEGLCKGCGCKVSSQRVYCDNCFDMRIVNPSKYTEAEKRILASNSVVKFRQRVKQDLVAYKGGACVRCGYSRCSDALEFHHVDPSQKDFSISGKSLSFEIMKKEVDKCILVCSNCHKEIHAELRQDLLVL